MLRCASGRDARSCASFQPPAPSTGTTSGSRPAGRSASSDGSPRSSALLEPSSICRRGCHPVGAPSQCRFLAFFVVLPMSVCPPVGKRVGVSLRAGQTSSRRNIGSPGLPFRPPASRACRPSVPGRPCTRSTISGRLAAGRARQPASARLAGWAPRLPCSIRELVNRQPSDRSDSSASSVFGRKCHKVALRYLVRERQPRAVIVSRHRQIGPVRARFALGR